MAEGELYGIGLDPLNPDLGVPSSATPNGSIGGSDVGANERDDQRVRDLVQQYLEEATTISWLNNLNFNGSDIVGGWFYSNWVVAYTGVGGLAGSYTGPNHTVTAPGGPLLIEYSASYIADVVDSSGINGEYSVEVQAQLYIDGVFLFQTVVEMDYVIIGGAARSPYLLNTMVFRAFLDPDDEDGIGGGFGTSQAEQIAACTAGAHTYRVDWDIGAANANTMELQISQELLTVRAVPKNIIVRDEI